MYPVLTGDYKQTNKIFIYSGFSTPTRVAKKVSFL